MTGPDTLCLVDRAAVARAIGIVAGPARAVAEVALLFVLIGRVVAVALISAMAVLARMGLCGADESEGSDGCRGQCDDCLFGHVFLHCGVQVINAMENDRDALNAA